MEDADAEELYPFVIGRLNDRNLAYLHMAFEETPKTRINWHGKLRALYRGVYFANGGLTRDTGAELIAAGEADAIVYGRLFLANPDLPGRFERNAPLNEPDQATFYTPGERGITDYPTLERAVHSPLTAN